MRRGLPRFLPWMVGLLGALPAVAGDMALRSASRAPDIAPSTAGPTLGRLGDTSFWTFERTLGEGGFRVEATADGDIVEVWCDDAAGMSASLRSRAFPVQANRTYRVRMELRTQGLAAVDARLTGSPYVRFWDAEELPGGYQPGPGLAPRDSDWHWSSTVVTTPSTARSAQLHLAFAAYGGYEEGLRPRNSGRARGRLWIRSVRIEPAESVVPDPPTLFVSDPAVQSAVETVFAGLHNSSILGRFVDSDGYADSSNIVPDLSFGLYGIRRQGNPRYMKIIQGQWEELGRSTDEQGKVPQRVMSQVLFPLGVDEIFSFTGDRGFLERMLPVADRALDFVARRADADGLARLVEYGQWKIGDGADWVDWYATRMEGKTFTFHQWYVRALRRLARLHDRFSREPGAAFASADRAAEYRRRAALVEASLRRLYWRGDHFVTNVDYGGQVADERWLDDQLWAIRLGTATPGQSEAIWKWIDANPEELEGVPTRWAAFDKPVHGPLTWFGRLGAGDILARYRSGNPARGMDLLRKISRIFARDHNVYEAYTMFGTIAPGTLGWGNYTEHCGGFLWAITEGPFGIDLDGDDEALAVIRPRLPDDWLQARATFFLEGTAVHVEHSWPEAGKPRLLRISAEGAPRTIRLSLPGKAPELVLVGSAGTIERAY
jgi:hypothetical protein